MSDITHRVRELFMYIMSSTWSIMNNKSQRCIYEHLGLVDYELVRCSGWSALLYLFMKSHGFHLRWGQTNVLKATASIYPYSNGPSGSTTTFALKLAPEKPQLGARNTKETTLFLRSVPWVFSHPGGHQWQQRLPRREYLPSRRGPRSPAHFT